MFPLEYYYFFLLFFLLKLQFNFLFNSPFIFFKIINTFKLRDISPFIFALKLFFKKLNELRRDW
jgi:hypothetical protein